MSLTNIPFSIILAGMENQVRPDSIYLTVSEQLVQVDQILREVVNTSGVPLIKEVSKHVITSGGKRFRPALAILSAKICGHANVNIPFLGAAIELIHTASLIHDDVLDEADLRRGVTTANARWGNHLSILVGDYCLSLASQMLSQHINPGVISILTEAAMKTTEGEILEAVHSNNLAIDVETYLNIIRLKTACLIQASCQAGSSLAEAPSRLTVALSEYGLNLGLAFQIIDDIMDYTTTSNHLGKKKGTDLREGKLTLPLIYALGRCRPDEKEIIKESLLAPTHSESNFRSVIGILDRYGCVTDARKTAREYLNQAIENLEPFKPSFEKEALIKFADFVLNRKH